MSLTSCFYASLPSSLSTLAKIEHVVQISHTTNMVASHMELHLIYKYFCLYIHTGLPNVTSLTFNSNYNTLTCTSTGGPATTVTWRKDGAVIILNATHQQTKKVVDSVEGTYQTVLTIDPSVSPSDIFGTYNCTVENARGKSSETVVLAGETIVRYMFYSQQKIYITHLVLSIPACLRSVKYSYPSLFIPRSCVLNIRLLLAENSCEVSLLDTDL